jgi:hypothetical protein
MSAASLTATPRALAAAPLSSVPRPRGRDLSGPELESFVRELAEQPELWIELVKHDADQRVYEELLSDQHVTAWLICWMDEQDTGFHDHDVSAGAVAVVGGRDRRPSAQAHVRRRRRLPLLAGRHPSRASRRPRSGGHATRVLAAARSHGRVRHR